MLVTGTRTERLDPQLLRIGAVLVAAPILASLDATGVGVATDSLTSSFHTDVSSVQWVSAGYLLAMALVIPAAGWLSDRFGAKTVWISAVAIFMAGSALCGVAWSLPALIGFRVLQAIGGGLMNPVGQALLARAAGPHRIGRLMSLLTIPVTFGPAVGPVVGGLLVDQLSWRWIFFVNVPICLLTLPIAARLLPAETAMTGAPLDWRGLALLSPGLAAAVYGFTVVGEGSPIGWWLAGGGLALVVAYVGHAMRTRGVPLIDVRLFARRGFSAATAMSVLLGASLYSSMVLVPLFFQQVAHASVLEAGLLVTPQAVGAAVGAFVAGRLTDRYGPRAVVASGIALAVVGTVAFAQPAAAGWLLTVSLLVRGLGIGAVMGPNMAAAYSSVEKRQASRASSAINVLNRIGGSLGTALLAVVLQAQLSQVAPVNAYAWTFWWVVGLSVVALVPAIFFPGRPKPATYERECGAGNTDKSG
ncbi:MDR family MFS transporter [Fodinicola acaciae]|uniref:MDR family MFS transporter n=1 Tax=Fodinicola acaciae TaxID=2681555 RepID=UPI0016521996|nr:MDR family MFS transporter [Fodinicola acaciae]